MNKKIQLLRGFAICAVVIGHRNAGGIVEVIDRPLLNFCVALFLFLSGFLSDLNIENLQSFYKRRLLRVGIPYIIWSSIYTVPLIVNKEFTYGQILLMFLTGKSCGPLYFIFVYAQLVLLAPLISVLARSKYRNLGFIISPLSIIITRYLLPAMNIKLCFPFGTENVFNAFLFYYVGFLLGNGIITYRKNMKQTVVMYVMFLIISLAEGLIWFRHGNFDMATTDVRLTSILTSLMATLLAYIFITDKNYELKNNYFNRFIVSLGNCSFGIYLSHILVMYVLQEIRFLNEIHFPFFAIIILIVTWLLVSAVREILGYKTARTYLGF